MRKLIQSALAKLGYKMVRLERDQISLHPPVSGASQGAHQDIAELSRKLAEAETMLGIRRRDAVEIEELLRIVALEHLPRRQGREHQLSNLIGTNIAEGVYLVSALHEALAVPGDICEFGVAQGATSALIASEIKELDRHFYLFDSFEGLPAPTTEDKLIDDIFNLGSMAAYAGTMASPEAEVLRKLLAVDFPQDRTHIRKGWVDQSLSRPGAPRSVCFAYVDFDFYKPIKVTLDYLDTVMPAGARIVVDDYGFFSEGAQLATDEFISASDGRWSLHKPLPMAGHFVTLRKNA